MHSVRSSSDMGVTVNGTVVSAMTPQDLGRWFARRAPAPAGGTMISLKFLPFKATNKKQK
jgi:hypothetical protein